MAVTHVLFAWRPGIWMLGEDEGGADTRRRQTTVMTWASLPEACSWAAVNQPDAMVELGTQLYTPRGVAMISALLVAARGITIGDMAFSAKSSLLNALLTAKRLEQGGYVTTQDAGELSDAVVTLTPQGRLTLTGIVAEENTLWPA